MFIFHGEVAGFFFYYIDYPGGIVYVYRQIVSSGVSKLQQGEGFGKFEKLQCSCIISKTKTQMQMRMQKSMHISVFIWFFRAPDEILGVLGPNPFWMSWRMAQKRISRKTSLEK